MRNMFLALMLLTWSPTLAFAQPAVFFDDFDGDALLPHWNVPPPSDWEYNLSNSMLNVTGLFSPSHPKSPTNFVTFGAYQAYTPQTDLQIDARMGWDALDTISRFELTVMINQGGVATIGYRSGFNGVFAGTSAGTVTIPAPASGMFDFRMTRIDGNFSFYFEGSLFATLPSPYLGPVDGIQFFLSSPYPGTSGPFYIDSVRVQTIPAPSALILLSGTLACMRRRSRVV